jgi:serine protease
MHKLIVRLALAVMLLASAVVSYQPALSAQPEPATRLQGTGSSTGWPTDQIILQYAPAAAGSGPAAAQLDVLSAAAGVALTYVREMSGDAHVLKLPERLPVSEVQAIADRLSALPEVAYAEPDLVMRPQLAPDDPEYANQWHYFAPVAGTYGANLPGAWDITTGDAGIRIAVLDTGILFTHADLVGRTVAGYDFITDVPTAGDGNGRDADPADPGDWVIAGECGFGSQPEDSSWHGTHVAGTIGAATDNAQGVAGINWVSLIQPVRVLGHCGGDTSDIADAIRWAAGLSVVGVPANATPSRVINLSLGGFGTCGPTFQNAINAAVGAGTVVVVAAGNSNANASGFAPANCNNVITVAANARNGDRAFYSNFGTLVEITAPGGETSPTLTDGVLSSLNMGTTVPLTDTYVYYQGTSMATPHVAGIASLILSVNPALLPSHVLSILQSTVTPFPVGSDCTTSLCGAGIINAAAAVARAQASEFVYVPLISRSSAPPTWTTIVQENFDGTFPTGLWEVTDPGYEEYYWAKRDCAAFAGGYSAWAMGGGSLGAGLPCNSDYINYANSWMVYGPFSLVGATAADLRYKLWANTEYGYDFVCRLASTNGTNFYGSCGSGTTGNWIDEVLDLSNVTGLGSVLGQANVWIAVEFDSDISNYLPVGAYVDNLVLRKCVGGPCPAANDAPPSVSGTFVEHAAERTFINASGARD